MIGWYSFVQRVFALSLVKHLGRGIGELAPDTHKRTNGTQKTDTHRRAHMQTYTHTLVHDTNGPAIDASPNPSMHQTAHQQYSEVTKSRKCLTSTSGY